MRRWARVGPIPVVPLGELGRFIECSACASTFTTDLLGSAPQRQAEDFVTRALRRAAGAILAVGGSLSEEQRREAVIVLQRYANVPYSSRDLDADVASAASHTLDEDLAPLATSLNEHGRNTVIEATAQLVTRTGAAANERLETLRAIARELTLPCPEARPEINRRLEKALLAG